MLQIGQREGMRHSRSLPVRRSGHGANHLRNHITGALDLHYVSHAQVLVANQLLVVQRSESHGGATDLHRVENCIRIQLTRAAHIDFDRGETRLRNVGSKFPRDGPARLAAADNTEIVLQPERVDLHHAAIDGEVELGAQLVLHAMRPDSYFFHRITAQCMRRDWNTPRSQCAEQLGLRLERKLPRVVERDSVAKKPKWARCSDRWIKLPEAACRRVARVCEHRLARSDACLVHTLELIERKVDLAANLDAATRRVRQTQRYVTDGANVGSDVLADGSVAARRADDEYSIFVRQTHSCAVDLELRRIAGSRDVVASDTDEAILPRVQLVIVESVGER